MIFTDKIMDLKMRLDNDELWIPVQLGAVKEWQNLRIFSLLYAIMELEWSRYRFGIQNVDSVVRLIGLGIGNKSNYLILSDISGWICWR